MLVGAGYELEVGRFSYGIYGVGSEVRWGRVDSRDEGDVVCGGGGVFGGGWEWDFYGVAV